MQIMLKLNRLEKLSDKDCIREKRQLICKNCQQIGHNVRTCNKHLDLQ